MELTDRDPFTVTPSTRGKGEELGYSGGNPRMGVFPVLPIFLNQPVYNCSLRFLRMSCFQNSKEGIKWCFCGFMFKPEMQEQAGSENKLISTAAKSS